MNFFLKMLAIFSLMVFTFPLSARENSLKFYHSFWLPKYQGERLSYCTLDNKECGLPLATRYCKLMGYSHADQQLIDHNIGLSHFLASKAICQGWRCDGFKTIRCVAFMSHKPPAPYYYRLRHYVYPRFNNYRVAWCYDGQHHCGRRAAHSFCRRMGYLTAKHFLRQKQIAATKAIGNQKLCFGNQCEGFAYIDCYR